MSCGETVTKNYERSGHLSTDHTVENMLEVHKLWMKTKCHFGDCWQVRPLVLNILGNYTGGLDGFFEIFALVADVQEWIFLTARNFSVSCDLPSLLAW